MPLDVPDNAIEISRGRGSLLGADWGQSSEPMHTVTEPAAETKGFGSRLIQRMLANDFSGEVRVTYNPSGIECELIAPLSALNDPADLS